jgi:type II secretory pathway component PulF
MEMTQELNVYARQPRSKGQSNVRIKSMELISFTNQLSIMLDSGVLISDALDAISEQTIP